MSIERPIISRIKVSWLISRIGNVPMLSPSRRTVTRSASAEQFLKSMRDINDSDAARLQLRDDTEQILRPGRPVTRLVRP